MGTKILRQGVAIDFSNSTPADHAINFSSMTLPDSTNVIRGASVNPTRASGWISFSGTVGATPAQVYTDYRELHTTGVAEVLGAGLFPFMDSGASCASMFALQAICEADSGSTVLTASGAPAVGIFPLYAKCLINGATFNSGGVAAAAFLSFQANVTDVSARDTSMINMEVASGGIQNVIKFQVTAAAGATNLFNFTDDADPVIAVTGYNDTSGAADKGLHILVGSTEYIIPAYQKQ